MRGTQEKWLSIVEYSNFKKVSVSTIRRYIKSNRVKYRLENGKYLIYCHNYIDEGALISEDIEIITELENENRVLKAQNQSLKEETHEMRMLIDLYETQLGIKKKDELISEDEIPELPK
jgi:hypothetical protein